MSTPNWSPPEAPLRAAPPLPAGWLANWSPEHNAWYYVFAATGATQWEYPTPPPDQMLYSPPPDHQSPPTNESSYAPAPEAADVPVQDGDRGLGKAALAMGSGFLAGTAFGHKTEGHHNHGLGKMTQSIAIAGAGAIGSKIFGLFGNKPQQNHQPSPTPQTQVHVYPVYVPGPQGSPMPGPPPPYHGQPPPVSQNFGHIAAGDGISVAPSVATPPAAHYPEGALPSGASGLSTFVPPSGPPLFIYGAVFADKDVTQIVRSLVSPQQTLTLKGDKLVEQLGDPWPEVRRKMFNVLYAYGDRPMELVAAELVTPIG
ncbi:hypothetical protein BGZ63DRAFT_356061 [Mariannaea sp. PMI_226]|nr:hypothetical protein BGZ63DRAFT_356061 [Mariannaea sp. PMI_226]